MSTENELLAEIDKDRLPAHVAIIMDGNGRWAKKKNLPRALGHKAGLDTVKDITRASNDTGIKYLTLYAFSTENWLRPKSEVRYLMKLMQVYLRKEARDMKKNNIKLITTGDITKMPKPVQSSIYDSIEHTKDCTGLVLNLCLNYGGRQEIISAVNRIIKSKLESVTEETFPGFLFTGSLPDPDLLIRTSGEIRVSNFLLWQIAYTEFYFTDVFWPDFSRAEFYRAILNYQQRHRRYGRI